MESKAVWMGNIDKSMDKEYIKNIFLDISNYNFFIFLLIEDKITQINLVFKDQRKKGSAIIEFESKEIAHKVLNDYNNKEINGQLLFLNTVKSNPKFNHQINSCNENKSSLFHTVSIILIIIYYVVVCRKYRFES